MSDKYLTKPTHPGYIAIETKCDYCDVIFWESKGSYLRKNRHFCKIVCYAKFQKELLPKEEHNSYGHGHSPEERLKRLRARSYLNHYLRDKKIERGKCEKCGIKAEAHHEDYSKPLEVRWLCFKHHRELHYENPELIK